MPRPFLPACLCLLAVAVVASAAGPQSSRDAPSDAPARGQQIAFMRNALVWLIDVDLGVKRIVTNATQYDRPLTWSPDGGELLFWRHSPVGWDLWRVNAEGGGARNLTRTTSGGCRSPAYSPDGTLIAFLRDDPPGVFIVNRDGSEMRRLTDKGHRDDPPVFNPDGKRIVYTVLTTEDNHSRSDLHVVSIVDYSDQLITPRADGSTDSPSWSSDGRFVLCSGWRSGNREICLIDLEELSEHRLTRTEEQEYHPAWSPDGRHIAYLVRLPDDKWQVRVMNADGSDARVLAATEGQAEPPRWCPDARRIAYVGGPAADRCIFIVDVNTGEQRKLAGGDPSFPAWRPGLPSPLPE